MKRTKSQFKGIDVMAKSEPSAPVDPKLASDQTGIACLKQGNIAGLVTLVQNYQVEAVHAALLIVRDRDLNVRICEMEEIMLRLSEFSHNHLSCGVIMLAKFIRRGIPDHIIKGTTHNRRSVWLA